MCGRHYNQSAVSNRYKADLPQTAIPCALNFETTNNKKNNKNVLY